MLTIRRLQLLAIALTSFLVVAAHGAERSEASSTLVANLEQIAANSEWQELSKVAAAAASRLARSAHPDGNQYGQIAAYRALAHYRLGETQDALWYWQVALNMSSDDAISVMARFPDAAEVFAAIGVPSIQVKRDPNVKPARPIRTIRPAILTVADSRRQPAAFGVKLIVGTDGVPRSPQLVGEWRNQADRIYSTFEALREWRFAPATIAGKAVEFPMSINLNVGASGGKPQLARSRRF